MLRPMAVRMRFYATWVCATGLGIGWVAACGSSDGGVADNQIGTGASTGTGGSGTGGGSAGGAATGGGGSSGSGGGINLPDATPPDQDTDKDCIPDVLEAAGDTDGDGTPDVDDPINDGPAPTISLTAISTTFNEPIGIDYHEPTNSVVLSVNYPTGTPSGFELIAQDGSHKQFSTLTGLTDEVKIATVRSGNPSGFNAGDLFVGNGVDGQIVRISADGNTVDNPWVDLPGTGNGLMRGSLFIDRTTEWGGDLVAVTTSGEVWRVTSAAVPTKVAAAGVHLEGALVVPNCPARYGPLAGKLIAGAEGEGLLHTFAPDGTHMTYNVGVAIEDIDLIEPKGNFFGVNYGTKKLLGTPAKEFESVVGDILLAQETPVAGETALYRLKWDGSQLVADKLLATPQSAPQGQWEHVTFAPAGIVEIQPVPK